MTGTRLDLAPVLPVRRPRVRLRWRERLVAAAAVVALGPVAVAAGWQAGVWLRANNRLVIVETVPAPPAVAPLAGPAPPPAVRRPAWLTPVAARPAVTPTRPPIPTTGATIRPRATTTAAPSSTIAATVNASPTPTRGSTLTASPDPTSSPPRSPPPPGPSPISLPEPPPADETGQH